MIPEPGYVRYVDHMGDDLSVVNAARASFDKQSPVFDDRDRRLMKFLAREGHTSVLRHAAITFEAYAPLMVARQWQKYMVASTHLDDQVGWNETSRRYVTEEPRFYVPAADAWRTAPENRKQGSGPPFDDARYATVLTAAMRRHVEASRALYDDALADGVAPEQARLFLPAYALYVRWRWTTSLAAVIHFLKERLAGDAQEEIQVYADEVVTLVARLFPETVEAWLQ